MDSFFQLSNREIFIGCSDCLQLFYKAVCSLKAQDLLPFSRYNIQHSPILTAKFHFSNNREKNGRCMNGFASACLHAICVNILRTGKGFGVANWRYTVICIIEGQDFQRHTYCATIEKNKSSVSHIHFLI